MRVFVKQLNRPMVTIIGRFCYLRRGLVAPSPEGGFGAVQARTPHDTTKGV